MEMFEIYNGSEGAHDIFLVKKAGATEYIMGRSYPLYLSKENPIVVEIHDHSLLHRYFGLCRLEPSRI